MANALDAQPERTRIIVLQSLRLFAVRKKSVSNFDGVSNGGALCEICGFAGGIGRENLRGNGRKQAA